MNSGTEFRKDGAFQVFNSSFRGLECTQENNNDLLAHRRQDYEQPGLNLDSAGHLVAFSRLYWIIILANKLNWILVCWAKKTGPRTGFITDQPVPLLHI